MLFIVNKIDTEILELEVIYNKLLYSNNGISYYDADTDRTRLGIIDLDRFNQTIINQSMIYDGSRYAAKLSLANKVVYYPNQNLYDNLKPLEGLKGSSGVASMERGFKVGYINNSVLSQSVLTIKVLRLRS